MALFFAKGALTNGVCGEDVPTHLRGLNRVFDVRLQRAWILYNVLLLDCKDTQSDLRLCCSTVCKDKICYMFHNLYISMCLQVML